MIELHATYAGPAIRKTEAANPTEIVTRLVEQNPEASRDVIIQLFVREIIDDEALVTACLKYFAWHAWQGLQPRKQRRQTSSDRAARAKAVGAIVEKLRRAVIISELLMPNNKPVAQCTGTEMAKFGRFGAAVSKIAKRRKVGDVMSEDQLWKLWKGTR